MLLLAGHTKSYKMLHLKNTFKGEKWTVKRDERQPTSKYIGIGNDKRQQQRYSSMSWWSMSMFNTFVFTCMFCCWWCLLFAYLENGEANSMCSRRRRWGNKVKFTDIQRSLALCCSLVIDAPAFIRIPVCLGSQLQVIKVRSK